MKCSPDIIRVSQTNNHQTIFFFFRTTSELAPHGNAQSLYIPFTSAIVSPDTSIACSAWRWVEALCRVIQADDGARYSDMVFARARLHLAGEWDFGLGKGVKGVGPGDRPFWGPDGFRLSKLNARWEDGLGCCGCGLGDAGRCAMTTFFLILASVWG